MNIIADRLFALLLGWTGSLFNGLWNLITNEAGAFAGFLRNFWLPMILILLLFGTVVDYVIWLIRWRPYYVWSSWLRRVIGKRRLHQTKSYMEDLDHSPLDLPEYQGVAEGQPGVYDEPIYFDFQAPYMEEEPFEDGGEAWQPMNLQEEAYQPELPVEDVPPAFVPSLPWENVREVPIATFPQPEEEVVPEGFIPYEPPLQDTLPPMPVFEEPYHPDDLALAEAQQAEKPGEEQLSLRRRRVDARRRRAGNVLKTIRQTIFDDPDAEEAAASLEPPVNPEAAFHKPYYPQSYQYREHAQKEQEPPL